MATIMLGPLSLILMPIVGSHLPAVIFTLIPEHSNQDRDCSYSLSLPMFSKAFRLSYSNTLIRALN